MEEVEEPHQSMALLGAVGELVAILVQMVRLETHRPLERLEQEEPGLAQPVQEEPEEAQ